MKLYLSSYKLGEQSQILKDWVTKTGDNKIALILNAADMHTPELRNEKKIGNIELLKSIGFDATEIDLRKYFGKEKELIKKLKNFRSFLVIGGNTFVLRQAMKLSGFDNFLISLKDSDDYLYVGWSAGICVLAPDLHGLSIVDNPDINPYNTETIWEGLGLLDYLPFPHYQSAHPEAACGDEEIAYAQKNNIAYKTLRDGEVILRDTKTGTEQFYGLTN